ncbi:MAG: OmpA family protein [bacterium]|nr:OmpA family protein [bacterium]
MSTSRVLVAVALCLGLIAASAPVDAGPFDRLKKKTEKILTDKVEDEVTKAVECAVGDKKCIDKAKKDGKEVVLVDDEGNPVENGAEPKTPADGPAPGGKPGEGVWRNYDYTPGRDVWKHIVFDDERIGRFPARQLEFVKGNMQIVEKDGRRVLEVAEDGHFRVHLDEALPDGFTLEFMLQTGTANMITYVYFDTPETSHSRYEHHYLQFYKSAGISLQGNFVSHLGNQPFTEGMQHVKLQSDGEYAILYVGNERVANVPNAKFARSKVIEFRVSANTRFRSYISDISVAVGLDRLYDALMDSGSFTTRGIYFDVDSDRLRGESTPTLMDIEDTLKRHAELKIRIEGHTDSTGDDAHNQGLSERRARAVVDYLKAQGIDGDRLQAVGLGEAQPTADNATPAGRQQNRRVVIALQQAG